MKKIFLIITLFTLIFIVSCSNEMQTLNQKETSEISDGYILTSKVFILKEAAEKPADDKIDHFEKEYVTENKVRIDRIFPNFEIREYKIINNGKITTTGCDNDNKEKKWICKEIYSGKLQFEKGWALQKLDDNGSIKELRALSKDLPDKKMMDFVSKCFAVSGNATICFHSEYYVKVYENRNNLMIKEATNLQFTTPEEKVFELPVI